MKMKKSGCKLIVFSLIVFIMSFSVFSAFAVDEDETPPVETYSEESQYTFESQETYDTEETTEAPTTEETYTTEEQTQETTTEETYTTEEQTQATTTEETYESTDPTEETETYAVLDNDLDDLPEADTAPTPTAAFTSKNTNTDLTYGIFSWACVIVGVLTVIIVLLSNKTGYYGGSGKQRYDEGNMIYGQKRLLNDEYYTNRKYNDYQNRDNYR